MKFELIGALVVLLACTAISPAQTLADVARRERERQKQLNAQNKGTFTNAASAVSPAARAETAQVPRPGAPAPLPAAAARPGTVDNAGHDQKYWTERFDQARGDA